MKAVHEDTVQPLLSILTKASEPALVLMLVQLPILISTLARDKKELSGTTWWNGTAECLSSIMTTGGTEAQVSAAYGLGILARIGCNPGAWGIEHGSCPVQPFEATLPGLRFNVSNLHQKVLRLPGILEAILAPGVAAGTLRLLRKVNYSVSLLSLSVECDISDSRTRRPDISSTRTLLELLLDSQCHVLCVSYWLEAGPIYRRWRG